MKLTLTYKKHFGKDLFYPACVESLFLCSLLDVRCLNSTHVKMISEHGWEVEIESLNLSAVLGKVK